jgi:ketosteroid isomerase-like protein
MVAEARGLKKNVAHTPQIPRVLARRRMLSGIGGAIMKHLCIVTLVLLAVSTAGPTRLKAQQAAQSAAAGAANVEQALETRFHEYADALKKKDTAALDKIWSDDYSFINPRGELVTKAQRLANVKTGATAFDDIEMQQEKVNVRGNTAVDIGRLSLKGTKYSGKEASGEYRYMNVWTKDQGQWRLLANQVTLITK